MTTADVRTPSHRMGARLSLLCVATAGILWGTTGVVVQLVAAGTGLEALGIGFYRLLIAAAVLLIISFPQRRRLLAALRAAPAATVAAGVGLAAYQALYFIGVRLSGVSIATVISLGLAPVLLSAWETARTRRRPSTTALAASGAALVGLLLIAGGDLLAAGAGSTLGLLAAVGSGATYAASTLVSRHAAQDAPPLAQTTLTCTVGAIALAPLAVVEGITFSPRLEPMALLTYAGAVTTALAYAFFYAGLRHTSGSVAVVVTLLEPLTAALLAVALLEEPLSAATAVGGVLLLGAVAALYSRAT